MTIDAGKLDRSLLIEAPNKTRSPTGQDVVSWTTVATVRAERLQLRASQLVELKPGAPDKGPGTALVSTARFRIRYRTDLAIGQRVTVEGASYTLTAVEPQDRRQSLIITVSA